MTTQKTSQLTTTAIANERPSSPDGKVPTTSPLPPSSSTTTSVVVPARKSSSSFYQVLVHEWKDCHQEFLWSQLQISIILVIAYLGNNWPVSYPRNDNHNMNMFWFMNVGLLIVAICTMKHEDPVTTLLPGTPAPKLQVLSRSQTEEWKGWMQWMFIMVRVYIGFLCFCLSCVFWSTQMCMMCHYKKKVIHFIYVH